MKILVTAPIKKFKSVIEEMKSFSKITVKEYAEPKEIKKIIKDFDGFIPNARTPIGEDILKNAKKLVAIYQPSLGYDHIDTNYLLKNKIKFGCIANDIKFRNTLWSTAEHTMGIILSLLKKINESNNTVKESGIWDNRIYHIEDLSDKTVGIIGFGNIGKKVGKLCKAFGAKIIVCDPYVITKKYQNMSLQEICKMADIISLHVPFNDETKNLISKQELSLLKKNSYLVNVSRGGIVNEDDLIEALNKKKLSAYGTDVLDKESPYGVSENRLVRFAKKNKNILITPHVGGSSYNYMEKIFLHSAKRIKNLVQI